LAAAFFAVAITISLIKLQKAPVCISQHGDPPPGGLPRSRCSATIAPVR
jgi:hypothetical protein